MDFQIPSWVVSGVVQETRELKSKAGDVFAFLIKVAALGGMFELQTRRREVYSTFGYGEFVTVRGKFDFYEGIPKFIITEKGESVTPKGSK